MKIVYTKAARRSRPSKGAVTLSASFHMAVVAFGWASTWAGPEPMVYETISVRIVEDAPVQGPEMEEPAPAPEEELVVETPEEEEPEEAPPEPEPEEEEAPPPPETTPDTPEPDPEPEEEPETTAPDAERTEGPSGEDLNVVMDGLRRDFPGYYANIIRQINRCFRPPPGRHSATVRFMIHRDGTVSEIDAVQSTGSIPLEIAAIEAVECAGRGRFGPLPDDFSWDVLPIEFKFDPRSGQE